eukprot:CAMPEP_0174713246 /NCGR_PEP_ID=MMETSP1094-20130205/13988_1 /TAXON_ID=156173 /ORGANISM="Chrysochromulina brevifilum, Strain UTEX LB 985" /LENGTH=41 /DNA_ID= /DNA_START= /DNA_END= /DNA_ORIENTATION=
MTSKDDVGAGCAETGAGCAEIPCWSQSVGDTMSVSHVDALS